MDLLNSLSVLNDLEPQYIRRFVKNKSPVPPSAQTSASSQVSTPAPAPTATPTPATTPDQSDTPATNTHAGAQVGIPRSMPTPTITSPSASPMSGTSLLSSVYDQVPPHLIALLAGTEATTELNFEDTWNATSVQPPPGISVNSQQRKENTAALARGLESLGLDGFSTKEAMPSTSLAGNAATIAGRSTRNFARPSANRIFSQPEPTLPSVGCQHAFHKLYNITQACQGCGKASSRKEIMYVCRDCSSVACEGCRWVL